MKVVAHIRNPDTGEVRACPDDYYAKHETYPGGQPVEIGDVLYMYEEGNYGCDCNRSLFWHRQEGEDEPDIECGHRWTIRLEVDGDVLYSDMDGDG